MKNKTKQKSTKEQQKHLPEHYSKPEQILVDRSLFHSEGWNHVKVAKMLLSGLYVLIQSKLWTGKTSHLQCLERKEEQGSGGRNNGIV